VGGKRYILTSSGTIKAATIKKGGNKTCDSLLRTVKW
jgi:hypothetical protein